MTKCCRSQFFLLQNWVSAFCRRNPFCSADPNLLFRSFGSIASSEAIPSHPSGSSAWQQVRAIHSPLNRKGGRKFASPSRLVCRHLPNTPTGPTWSSPFDSSLPNVYDLLSPAVLQPHQSVVGAGRPSRFLRDQKTFGAGPCSFSS